MADGRLWIDVLRVCFCAVQGQQVRLAEVPEGVSESRVLWHVLLVLHPGSICSVAAFFPRRARLVADSSQHLPFIGDVA